MLLALASRLGHWCMLHKSEFHLDSEKLFQSLSFQDHTYYHYPYFFDMPEVKIA